MRFLLLFLTITAHVQAFRPVGVVQHRRPTTTTTQTPALNMLDVSAVDTFYQTQPYMAAFLTCACKASAADLFAQKNKDPDQDTAIDVSRNLAFLAYGGIWQGLFQQFLFTALYPLLFAGNTWDSILGQVAFDTTVMGPMVCLPIVYTVKNLFRTGDLSGETVTEALETYYDHVTTRGLLTTYWYIWIPAQCATFGFVPPHLRVLFVAAVSFFWVTKLSAISASDSQESKMIPIPVSADPVPIYRDWTRNMVNATHGMTFN
jgi:hypothetical protein